MERLDLCQQSSPVDGKGSYVSDIRAGSCADIISLGHALGDHHLAVVAACLKLWTKRPGGPCCRHGPGRGSVSLALKKSHAALSLRGAAAIPGIAAAASKPLPVADKNFRRSMFESFRALSFKVASAAHQY